MYYNVFVNKASHIPEERYQEFLDKCIELVRYFMIPEFKSSVEALNYVYKNEKKYSADCYGTVALKNFCAFYLEDNQTNRFFYLYGPDDEVFCSYTDANAVYFETNRKSYDAVVKLLLFLYSRYANGFFSHDGESFDYFIECLDNYYPEDRELYINYLSELSRDYNLVKFGIKPKKHKKNPHI